MLVTLFYFRCHKIYSAQENKTRQQLNGGVLDVKFIPSREHTLQHRVLLTLDLVDIQQIQCSYSTMEQVLYLIFICNTQTQIIEYTNIYFNFNTMLPQKHYSCSLIALFAIRTTSPAFTVFTFKRNHISNYNGFHLCVLHILYI